MAEVKVIKATRGVLKADTSTAVTLSTADYIDVSDVDTSKLLFQVARGAGAQALTFKVLSGSTKDNLAGPYTGGTIPDYTKATTASGSYLLGNLETHRYKTEKDRIYFGKRRSTNSTAGTTSVATIKAYLLP